VERRDCDDTVDTDVAEESIDLCL